MRTYGLSGSGMDVDKMVSDLMKARRVPYDRIYQKKTQLEWKKTDYNKLYKSLNSFRDTLFNYKLQSNLVFKSATSTDDKYVAATANPDAVNISHSISVSQLASGATRTSSEALPSAAGPSSPKTLGQQFGGTGIKTFTVTNNGQSKEISVNLDTETVYDLVSKINQSGIKVSANYDASVNRLFLATTNTGNSAAIDVAGADAAWFTDSFKLTTYKTGTNANFKLDGVDYGDSANITSNKFTLAGVTYDLKNTTPVGYNVQVSVANDIDKAVTAVKSLVEAYNKVLTEVNAEVSEKYYKDFQPLTDEQKKDMKENDIKLWEEKAKSGMLRRDPILTDMLNRVRMDFSSVISDVSGKYNSAASIGINTGSYFDKDGNVTGESKLAGFLYVDEKKLRAALQEDPNVLYTVFGTDKNNPDGTNAPSKDGIAVRIYDSLKTYLDKVKTEAGFTASPDDLSNIGKLHDRYEKEMVNMARRLKMVETRYYNQFNAMEKAISRMNQQSAWIAQSFGGGSKQ